MLIISIAGVIIKMAKYSFKSAGVQSRGRAALTNRAKALPIGIRTPMALSERDGNVFEMHTSLIESIKDNLKNLLLTNRGERLINPSFGASITELTMELGNEDGDTLIMNRISEAVSSAMPFVSLVGYDPVKKLTPDGAINKLSFTITFLVPALDEKEHSIELTLYEAG